MLASLSEDFKPFVESFVIGDKISISEMHKMLIKYETDMKLDEEFGDFSKLEMDYGMDWLAEINCAQCGSSDLCECLISLEDIEWDDPLDSGIFMIDCLLTSYESWVLDTGCGNHICNNLQGFTRSRSLGRGELDLRVANGAMIGAEAVGTYELKLPTGLVLILNNCYYVPRLIKSVISYDLLIDDGFNYASENKTIFAYKNNVFYFKAHSQNGLYMINLRDDNDREIYHINSDIDQTYLWHCRLGHINENRIKKLITDGSLESFDFKSFDNLRVMFIRKNDKVAFQRRQ